MSIRVGNVALADSVANRLGPLRFHHVDKNGNHYWVYLCSCGVEIIVAKHNWSSGHTKSCGCLQREQTAKANTSHGESIGVPEYRAWRNMLDRCGNQRRKDYKHYGGRGISVCSRWRDSYKLFLSDMGRKPSADHSLDRIENNGNYCPGNCRWATKTEQLKNRRRWAKPKENLNVHSAQ